MKTKLTNVKIMKVHNTRKTYRIKMTISLILGISAGFNLYAIISYLSKSTISWIDVIIHGIMVLILMAIHIILTYIIPLNNYSNRNGRVYSYDTVRDAIDKFDKSRIITSSRDVSVSNVTFFGEMSDNIVASFTAEIKHPENITKTEED